MKIKQLSFCTFEIESDQGKIIINPTKKSDGDIKIYSLKNSPYLNYETNGELIIDAAGEYERKDIFVHSAKNTNEYSFVFNISTEGLTIGVIGFCPDLTKLPDEFFETTDVLIIGVGGGMNADSKNAMTVVEKLSPSIAILFGVREQAGKDVANILESIEEVKKNFPLLSEVPKTLKIDEDDVKDEENTVYYYIS